MELDGLEFSLAEAGIARLVHEASVGSTMDRAHALAADGAPSGTLVLADVQRAARGRGGKPWSSELGDGLWFTLVERRVDPAALTVLSIRVGLAVATAVSRWCDGRLGLKWPNDVLVAPHGDRNPAPSALRKLAGILVEARWRDGQPEWVAIGVGVNFREPRSMLPGVRASSLRAGTSRGQVLTALVPELRRVAGMAGLLSEDELEAWRALDFMTGRRCLQPTVGEVLGIAADGALRVAQSTSLPDIVSSRTVYCRSGSLVLQEEVSAC